MVLLPRKTYSSSIFLNLFIFINKKNEKKESMSTKQENEYT